MHYDYKLLPSPADRSAADGGVNSKVNIDFPAQESVELYSLREDMQTLDEWCQSASLQNAACFFAFFQDAILGAYQRYQSSKRKAWSLRKFLILGICTAISPVLATIVLSWVTDAQEQLLPAVGIAGFCVIGLVWILSYVYSKWQDNCSYRETWVRHSVCYNRLHLALSHFLSSSRSANDFSVFIESTFSALEQNFDQFVLNLSPKGAAPAPNTKKVK